MTFARRPRRSSSHAARPVSFEPIEARLLMASAINAAIDDAIARVSDRAQYAKGQLDATRQWAVVARPNADVGALASAIGATGVAPSGVVDGIYVATFARSKVDRLGGAHIGHAIDKADAIGAAWPLVARQQTKRAIPTDPRFPNQWHLRNTGQGGGTVGADANVVNVWDQYKGNGVVIGVVDDGVTPGHQDLAANYLPAFSYDFNNNDAIPDSGSHGTSVAGVSSMPQNNGVGGSGSAPLSKFAGLKLIAGPSSDSQEANALSYFKNDIDIYGNSWGPSDSGTVLEAPGPLTLATFQNVVTTGRNGLGGIYTWAGGNGGDADNVNFDGYANSRYTIAVGALTNYATRSSYSERGASLLVSAYSNGGSLGIDTTAGSSSTAYTTGFGGTSSATPLVSGVIALVLEANPNLTWRDVQQVLAKSAEKVSPTDAGWSLNGAGLNINDKFGYGGIDAAAAVDLARNWSNVAPEVSATTGTVNVSAAIPAASATGLARTVDINEPIRVETVELVLNATHASRGELQVILISPSGTQSVMATERSDTGDNFANWTFTTKRLLDEDARGTWTVKIIDDSGTTAGNWGSFKLNVYGTQLNASPTASGTLYADVNGSGAREGDESGLANITVWADLDNDAIFDAAEPSAVTTATGSYAITGLALETYTIRALAPAGQFVTEAAGGRTVTLTASSAFAGSVNFGVVAPSATGVAFDDLDADGTRDPSEPALAGVTVFADLDADGTRDSGEPTSTSAADGAYRVVGLPVGAATVIRTVAPAGRRLTNADANGFSFAPASGAYVAAGRDVGSTTTVRISGRSFDDRDRDGTNTPGEPGIAGVRVFLDANDNGIFDDTNYDYVQNAPQSIPDDRVVRTSSLVVSGAAGNVNNLSVRVNLTHTFIGDLAVTLISPTGTRVSLMSGNGGSADGFNVTFNATAATTPTSWPTSGVVTGTYRPLGNLATLNGQALDGTWRLEIVDQAGGDFGTLNTWSFFGGSTETSTLTAADGTYAFDALPAATYRVRQAAPPAPFELASAAAGLQTVVAASGTVSAGRDFANLDATAPVPPTFVSGAYAFDAPAPAVTLTFGSGVIVEPGDLTLVDRTTGSVVPASAMSVAFDAATSTATVTFPGLAAGTLADADYRLTVGTGVVGENGAPLAAAADVDFFVLAGDVNRDRTVSFPDLVVLAQNYGTSGRAFSAGNLDYSAGGEVNFADLVILAQRYGTTIATVASRPGAAPAVPSSRGTGGRRGVAGDVLA